MLRRVFQRSSAARGRENRNRSRFTEKRRSLLSIPNASRFVPNRQRSQHLPALSSDRRNIAGPAKASNLDVGGKWNFATSAQKFSISGMRMQREMAPRYECHFLKMCARSRAPRSRTGSPPAERRNRNQYRDLGGTTGRRLVHE